MTTFNIYCDESCHLEHDQQKVMVVGAVWCPAEKTKEIAERLREIKTKHGLPRWFESKWSKVSPGRLDYYRGVLDYFFDDDDLRFRAVIVPDKGLLRHEQFAQDHDTFYYKMYYTDDFSYIVVLADRRKYVILWTAYCVEQENRREKLRREYQRYVARK